MKYNDFLNIPKPFRKKANIIVAKSANEPQRCAYELRCLVLDVSQIAWDASLKILERIAVLDKEQAKLAFEQCAILHFYHGNSDKSELLLQQLAQFSSNSCGYLTKLFNAPSLFKLNDIGGTWFAEVERISQLYPDAVECSSVLCSFAQSVANANLEIAKVIANSAILYDREKGTGFYVNTAIRSVVSGNYDLAREMAQKALQAYPDAPAGHLVIDVYERLPSDICFNITHRPIFKVHGQDPTSELADAIEYILEVYKTLWSSSEEKRELAPLFKELFDFEAGIHLSIDFGSFINKIKELDLKGINFLGLRVNNQLITRELLEDKKVDTAGILFTKNDVNALNNPVRKEAILTRLNFNAKRLGEEVNDSDYFNSRSVYDAALEDDINLLEKRLVAGINPLKKARGKYPLEAAASKGNIAIARRLITDFEHSEEAFNAAIMAAKENKQTNIVKLLSLHDAIETKNLKQVKKMANQRNVHFRNIKGETPLYVAVRRVLRDNQAEVPCAIIEELLSHSLSLEDIYNALVFQFFKSSCTTAKISLLSAWKQKDGHTDYKVPNYNSSTSIWYDALLFEAINCDAAVTLLSHLEECGADLNYERRGSNLLDKTLGFLSKGYKPERYTKVLNFLISRKIDLNKTDTKGNTKLHHYAAENDLYAVEQLIRHGADLTYKNKAGKTPFDIALENKVSQTIITLLTLPTVLSPDTPSALLSQCGVFSEKGMLKKEKYTEGLLEMNNEITFS